jgi:uncharacterized membrane protein
VTNRELGFNPGVNYQIQYIQINLLIGVSLIISIMLTVMLELKKAIISNIISFLLFLINAIFSGPMIKFLPIFVLSLNFGVICFLFYSFRSPNHNEIEMIKRSIIVIAQKFTIVKIKEVSEQTNSDKDTIKKVVSQLIQNGNIKAVLFKRTNSIAFFIEE